LLIPALCGNLDNTAVIQALSHARHIDLKIWEKENVPYTMRKKRQTFSTVLKAKKRGKYSVDKVACFDNLA